MRWRGKKGWMTPVRLAMPPFPTRSLLRPPHRVTTQRGGRLLVVINVAIHRNNFLATGRGAIIPLQPRRLPKIALPAITAVTR